MQISVTSRHMELTEALKNYVKSKIVKLNKYLDDILDANIILSVENKHRHIAEITLTARGMTFNSENTTDNMYSSIDRVIDKLEAQVKKFKEKKKEHKQKHKIPSKEMHLTSELMSAEILEKKDSTIDLIKTKRVNLEHMTVDDAINNIGSDNFQCFMFINIRTNEINTIYKNPEGKLIVLEPDFRV
ncbi:MAG: ribosome hibernation-promoting factor, HPF/YfiA family [bacterium]